MENLLNNEYFSRVYYSNTMLDYLIALSIILLGMLIIRVFKNTILKRIKAFSGRSQTHFNNYLVTGIERFGLPAMYYTIIYIGLNYLTFSQKNA